MEENYYNKDKVEGFYYDHQIYNPLYTMSLHPNTRPIMGEDKVVWKDDLVDKKDLIISSIKNKDIKQHWDSKWEYYFTRGFSESGTGKIEGKLPVIHSGAAASYYAEPICSSIFSEDFNFTVANEWTNWDGGNFLENAFKGLKSYAPMVGSLTKGLKGLDENQVKGEWAKTLTSGAKKIGEWIEDTQIESTLNKALYIQGTRYSMYNGTATNFGNMTMKFTLLSDWKPLYPGSDEFVFMSVYDQFAYIYPYCMGLYEKDNGPIKKGFDKHLEGVSKEIVDQFFDNHVSWQAPPAGFESINRNIDVQQKGTLRLMLGGYYTIDNLVIKSMSVNLSRQLCKVPTIEIGEKMVPLYADVVLELQPVSVFTDVSLGRFINNSGMNGIHVALEKAIEIQNQKIEEAKKAEAQKNQGKN